jgi:copper homeostasis protein
VDALEQLIDLGFTRIMTSGGAPTAMAGAAVIRRLIEQARGRIEVLPVGGIVADNVRELITETGCRQIHGSFRRRRLPSETLDPATVAEVRKLLDS